MATTQKTPRQKEIARLFKAAESCQADLDAGCCGDDGDDSQDPMEAEGVCLEEMEICYREIVRIDPTHFEAHKKLGELFLNQHFECEEEALSHFENAARLKPDDKDIQNGIKKCNKAIQKAEKKPTKKKS